MTGVLAPNVARAGQPKLPLGIKDRLQRRTKIGRQIRQYHRLKMPLRELHNVPRSAENQPASGILDDRLDDKSRPTLGAAIFRARKFGRTREDLSVGRRGPQPPLGIGENLARLRDDRQTRRVFPRKEHRPRPVKAHKTIESGQPDVTIMRLGDGSHIRRQQAVRRFPNPEEKILLQTLDFALLSGQLLRAETATQGEQAKEGEKWADLHGERGKPSEQDNSFRARTGRRTVR